MPINPINKIPINKILSKLDPKESNEPVTTRQPSILVTDSRDDVRMPPSPAAVLAAQSKRRKRSSFSSSNTHGGDKGKSNLKDVNLNNLLAQVDDVPSARRRHGDFQSDSQDTRVHIGDSTATSGMGPKRVIGQNIIPQRTTKTSQKVVLLPVPSAKKSEEDKSHPAQSDLSTDEFEPADIAALGSDSTNWKKRINRSHAENLTKTKRNEKNLSRVTAYCTAEAYRLTGCKEFLEKAHDASDVIIYDELIYAKYYLPLLRGGVDDEARVRSNNETKEEILMESDDESEGAKSDTDAPREINLFDGSAVGSSAILNDASSQKDVYDEDSSGKYHIGDQRKSSKSMKRRNSAPASVADMSVLYRQAEVFVLSYGVVVFWNFTERQERDILADLTLYDGGKLVSRPMRDDNFQIEDFHFEYSFKTKSPRVYNDMITLRSGNHWIKLAMSHAIAQSVKMSVFEVRMDDTMEGSKWVPGDLALKGDLGLTRSEVLKLSGHLFRLRMDVNLSTDVLDTPNIFWDTAPHLYDLYSAARGMIKYLYCLFFFPTLFLFYFPTLFFSFYFSFLLFLSFF